MQVGIGCWYFLGGSLSSLATESPVGQADNTLFCYRLLLRFLSSHHVSLDESAAQRVSFRKLSAALHR